MAADVDAKTCLYWFCAKLTSLATTGRSWPLESLQRSQPLDERTAVSTALSLSGVTVGSCFCLPDSCLPCGQLSERSGGSAEAQVRVQPYRGHAQRDKSCSGRREQHLFCVKLLQETHLSRRNWMKLFFWRISPCCLSTHNTSGRLAQCSAHHFGLSSSCVSIRSLAVSMRGLRAT